MLSNFKKASVEMYVLFVMAIFKGENSTVLLTVAFTRASGALHEGNGDIQNQNRCLL